jgi:hypothetical protein
MYSQKPNSAVVPSRYLSDEEIMEMLARDYDRSVIDEAVALSGRHKLLEVVKDGIRTAFADERLGSGVGLWEAQAIDDYADEQTQTKYRKRDEKTNWQLIPVDDLNTCCSSLSFFDPEGMRFCLPAFLIADLDGTYINDVVFTLTQTGYEQFALLNDQQIAAVRNYLRFLESEPDYEFDRAHIQKALQEYWAANVA